MHFSTDNHQPRSGVYFTLSSLANAGDSQTPDGRDECGVRDPDTGMERECTDDRVCLLEGLLNRCVRSKFLKKVLAVTYTVASSSATSP